MCNANQDEEVGEVHYSTLSHWPQLGQGILCQCLGAGQSQEEAIHIQNNGAREGHQFCPKKHQEGVEALERIHFPMQLLIMRGKQTRIIGLKRSKNACALKEDSGGESYPYSLHHHRREHQLEEIIADQFYKFIYKTDLSSSLPFPGIVATLCLNVKVTTLKDDTLINQEMPIMGEVMVRVREPRARNPQANQARQEAPQQQQPPQEQPQVHQQQEFPSNFYTHFDNSMSMIYKRLDSQQEESRRSFEAINARMDRMDDQLSFLCYSNQMVNETMYFPYKNTARQMKEMEMQGIPVTIANLAIHRHREEEMNQERMRHDQMVQEATTERAREANKGKAREVVPDSEEESEELASSASEE
ncbi:hypothetical protein PIB30_061595, partial [Stylosanthes scabra]|nr:hypothetical protein [Stylosanthes scabra]